MFHSNDGPFFRMEDRLISEVVSRSDDTLIQRGIASIDAVLAQRLTRIIGRHPREVLQHLDTPCLLFVRETGLATATRVAHRLRIWVYGASSVSDWIV